MIHKTMSSTANEAAIDDVMGPPLTGFEGVHATTGPSYANRYESGDAASSLSTSASMSVGDTFYGTVSTAGDTDMVKVSLIAGHRYTVSLTGNTLVDPVLQVYDRNGQFVAQNDDYNDGYDSRLSFTPSMTATYYLSASEYSSGTGTYRLQVAEAAPLARLSYDAIAAQLTDVYWGGSSQAYDVSANSGTITYNLSGLSSAGQTLALGALKIWAETVGLNFVATSGSADLSFTNSSAGAFTTASLLYTPTDHADATITSSTVNISTAWLSTNGTGYDSYSFQTYIHEIGHALGLGHAGDYNGSAEYETHATYLNDSWQASIMSYFSQDDNTAIDASYAYVVSPMIADVLAMRALYGVANDLRTGNTVYGYNSNAGGMYQTLFEGITSGGYADAVTLTIVDNGGFDTLDLSGETVRQRVDLRGGQVSDAFGLVGNLSIALGTVIEAVIGGSGGDSFTANATGGTITGNGGNDIVFGGSGKDTVFGGADNDWINGYGGNDSIFGDAGNDTIRGDSGADYLNGGEGANWISAGTGDDRIVTRSGRDTIYGGMNNDTVYGGGGDDKIYGETGNDRLCGEDGNDTIYGGDGWDVIYGGAGNDRIEAEGWSDWVSAEGGRDVVLGGSGKDTIYGGDDDDWINGNSDNDSIFGDAGNDTIRGESGADYLNGGDGRDWISAGTGDDRIVAGAANDTVYGGMNNDTVYGGTGNDWINGETGNDRLCGEDGNDTIYGGDGFDVIYGGAGDDRLDAGGWSDWVSAEGGRDVVLGGSGNDTIYGGDDNDWISASSGNDAVYGDAGQDTIYGGSGNDYLNGGSGADWINAGDGNDRIVAGSWNDTVYGGTGDDTVYGMTGNDWIRGEDGNDRLVGESGNDTIYGGAGDDVLIGGTGRDVMTGDGGADTFIFVAIDESAAGVADQITDFTSGTDHIDLSAFTASWIGTSAFSNTAGQVRFTQSGGVSHLEFDQDGDGRADLVIDFVNDATIANGDLIL